MRANLAIMVYVFSAHAAYAEATRLSGPVIINASSKNASAVSIGVRTSAIVENGSVEGGATVKGSTQLSSTSKNAHAIAIGRGSNAKIVTGSVASSYSGGPVKIKASLGTGVALAYRPGGSACIATGSVAGRQLGGARTNARVGRAMVADFGFFHKTNLRIGSRGNPCN